MNFKFLAVPALLVLFACGGGGGSSKSDSDGGTPTPPATITSFGGAASKGIIQNGQVAAYELVGGVWTQRGTATTDTKGNYTVQMTGYTGKPTKVTITAGSGSTMIWDGPTGGGHTFGAAEPLPSTFTMSAVTPAVTGTSTSIPVTPYTNMAAGLVEASLASASATSVQTAISTVNVLVGFDTASTPVVDVTNAAAMAAASPTAQQAAAMSAAVTYLAGSGSVATAVANLASSMASGSFTIGSAIPIGSLVQAWTSAAGNANIASNMAPSALTNMALVAQTVTSQISNGGYTPVPPANVPVNQVAAAKGLIGDTRSFVYNVMATNPQAPLKALGVDLDANVNVFNRDTLAMMQILGIGLKAAVQSIGTGTTFQTAMKANGSASYTIPVTSNGTTLGTLQVNATNPAALTLAVSGSLKGTAAGAKTVIVSANLTSTLDLNQLNVIVATTTQTAIKINLTASIGDGTTTLAITGGALDLTLTGSADALFVNTFKMTDLGLTIQAPGASFTGKAGMDFIHANSAAISTYFHSPYELLGVKTVKLDGTFNYGSVLSTASVELDVNNADTFDLDAFLNAGRVFDIYGNDPSVLSPTVISRILVASKIPTAQAGDSWHLQYGYDPRFPIYQGGTYASSSGYGYRNGVYTNLNPTNATESYPALLAAFDPATAYVGTLASMPPGTQVVAKWVGLSSYGWNSYGVKVQIPAYIETGSNFLNATFKASFTASGISGLPAVAVSALVNRKTLAGGDATFTLTWGSSTYTIGVTVTDVATGTGTITVTNPQGVAMTIQSLNLSKGTGSGTITVGGVKVADVAVLRSGLVKITYSDGTFESFQ